MNGCFALSSVQGIALKEFDIEELVHNII
jgi:hypothetical protein